MKIAVIIVRVLMGLLFLFASITWFLDLFPKPELKGDVKIFNDGIEISGYIMFTVKAIELICGLAFVVGRFVPLATVVISPIILNILLFHAFLAPEGLPIALFLLLGNLFLAFHYRKNYSTMMTAK